MGNRGKMEENGNCIACTKIRENTNGKVAIVPGPSKGLGTWSQAGPRKPIPDNYYNVQVYLLEP